MNYLSIFLVSFTIAFSGALVPGPILAAVIYRSTRNGFKSGPLIILGHALIELALVVLLIVNVTAFIRDPMVFSIIRIIGGLILAVSGVKLVFSRIELPGSGGVDKHKLPDVFLGIILSVANPYWLMWWLTIGLGLVLSANKAGLTAVLAFFTGHIFADFIWYAFVSFSVSRGKKFITPNIYRLLIYICGLTLVGFGIYFVV